MIGHHHPDSPALLRPLPPPTLAGRRSPLAQLPAPLSPIVGREREAALAVSLLRRDDVRLLTLTGPGGVGKTRLGLRVATDLVDDFADGVRFVSLAAVHDADLVAATVAHALGVPATADVPVAEALASALRDAADLLVLDNFEHVLAAAPLLSDLLPACPRLKILVTSRALLRVAGEHALPVPPLALPEPRETESVEALAQSPAVQLFVARGQAVSPSFALTASTAPVVADVCRRLDGLPLAIELAAARINHLPLPLLRERLERRLPLLIGRGRDQPRRLQTMRGAIAWSHELLTPEEQALFRRLSVFVGGFTLEAAEHVGGRGGRKGDEGDEENDHLSSPSSPSSPSVLDGLAGLVDKSLLQQDERPHGAPRFLMLETIREFADEQLVASGEAQSAPAAHAAYYVAFADRHQLAPFLPDDYRRAVRFEAEYANLQAALTWLLTASDPSQLPRLVAAVSWVWFVCGHGRDARTWLERGLDRGEAAPPAVRSRMAVVLGLITMAQGDPARGRALGEHGLSLARSDGDRVGAVRALIAVGLIANAQGEYERAATSLEEALTLARSIEDPRTATSLASTSLANLGVVARGRGQWAEAAARHEEALAGFRAAGNVRGEVLCLLDLGDVARDLGEHACACERYRAGLRLARGEYGDTQAIYDAVAGVACVAAAAGRAIEAARWFGAADRLHEVAGTAFSVPVNRLAYERAMAAARTALGEDAFAAAWAGGRDLPVEQAITEALTIPMTPIGPPPSSLSTREHEVLGLLVAGTSDREIAAALFISVRTAEGHVARLLAKLGAPTRAAAVKAAIAAGFAVPHTAGSPPRN